MAVSVETVAEAMFDMVKASEGKKRYKPGDVTKEMMKKFADDGIDRGTCKEAIKILVDSERLVYSYFGGSFLEIPRVEGAAKG